MTPRNDPSTSSAFVNVATYFALGAAIPPSVLLVERAVCYPGTWAAAMAGGGLILSLVAGAALFAAPLFAVALLFRDSIADLSKRELLAGCTAMGIPMVVLGLFVRERFVFPWVIAAVLVTILAVSLAVPAMKGRAMDRRTRSGILPGRAALLAAFAVVWVAQAADAATNCRNPEAWPVISIAALAGTLVVSLLAYAAAQAVWH